MRWHIVLRVLLPRRPPRPCCLCRRPCRRPPRAVSPLRQLRTVHQLRKPLLLQLRRPARPGHHRPRRMPGLVRGPPGLHTLRICLRRRAVAVPVQDLHGVHRVRRQPVVGGVCAGAGDVPDGDLLELGRRRSM